MQKVWLEHPTFVLPQVRKCIATIIWHLNLLKVAMFRKVFKICYPIEYVYFHGVIRSVLYRPIAHSKSLVISSAHMKRFGMFCIMKQFKLLKFNYFEVNYLRLICDISIWLNIHLYQTLYFHECKRYESIEKIATTKKGMGE